LQAQATAEMATVSDQVQIHYGEAPRQVAALEKITKYNAYSFTPMKTGTVHSLLNNQIYLGSQHACSGMG
jgi:hypothetical protein